MTILMLILSGITILLLVREEPMQENFKISQNGIIWRYTNKYSLVQGCVSFKDAREVQYLFCNNPKIVNLNIH